MLREPCGANHYAISRVFASVPASRILHLVLALASLEEGGKYSFLDQVPFDQCFIRASENQMNTDCDNSRDLAPSSLMEFYAALCQPVGPHYY